MKAGVQMDKQKVLLIVVVLIGVPLFIWIQFFEVPNKVKIGEEKMQQDPTTHQFEKVQQYEQKYMGDASNIGQLFEALPLGNYKGTFEMEPEDFFLNMNYLSTSEIPKEKIKQAVLYNTTATFVLINNLEEIEMSFDDESYVVRKENVVEWFGEPITELKNPQAFMEKIQDQLLIEDIDTWFAKYIEK